MATPQECVASKFADSRALLGRACLRCQRGKLLEPETIHRARDPSDHPDPFTSCKPPFFASKFRTRNRDFRRDD